MTQFPTRAGPVCILAFAAATLVSSPAWACSGPGAPEAILRAELLGWGLFVATLLVGVVATVLARRYRSRWRGLWPLPFLVAVHPGWWMSARSGDCGRTLSLASVVATVLALVIALLVVGLARRAMLRTARP